LQHFGTKWHFAIAACAAFAELLPQTQRTIGTTSKPLLTFNLSPCSDMDDSDDNSHCEGEEFEEFYESSSSKQMQKLRNLHNL
jgi:hypothetical protein